MVREPIRQRGQRPLSPSDFIASWSYAVLALLSKCYPPLSGRLPTCYSPVRRFTKLPKEPFSLDLHVLSTPPAFVLSQDQTLQLKSSIPTTSRSSSGSQKSQKFFRTRPEGLARRTRTSLPAIQFSRNEGAFAPAVRSMRVAQAPVRRGANDKDAQPLVNGFLSTLPGAVPTC